MAKEASTSLANLASATTEVFVRRIVVSLFVVLLLASTSDGSTGNLHSASRKYRRSGEERQVYQREGQGAPPQQYQQQQQQQQHRRRRHPGDNRGYWSPSQELYPTSTTLRPEAWVFAEHNSTAAAEDGVSRVDRVVRAHIGSNAILDCVVKKGSQFGMITWARLEDERRPYSVLTIGDSNYVEDKRFIVLKPRKNQDMLNWALQIRGVSPEDAGRYECQATTHPPQNIVVKFRVVEAVSQILGSKEKIIKSGSTLKLHCILKRATEKPLYIFWYHDERMINYDSDRGVSVKNDNEGSTLLLENASAVADSGNYTCSPYNIRPSWVVVHVLGKGNSAAAVQNGDGETTSVADSGGSAGGVVGQHGQPQPPSAAVHSAAAAALSSHSLVSTVIVLLIIIIVTM